MMMMVAGARERGRALQMLMIVVGFQVHVELYALDAAAGRSRHVQVITLQPELGQLVFPVGPRRRPNPAARRQTCRR